MTQTVDIAGFGACGVEETKADKIIDRVHYAVGTQTKAMSLGSWFSPAWITRVVNKRLAH